MSENFIQRYCFDADDMNSIYSNLMRAYDNGITLRESMIVPTPTVSARRGT